MSTSVGIGVGVIHGGLGDTGAPAGPVITLSDITPADAKVYESALSTGSAPNVANLVVTGTISVDYGVPGPAAVDPLTINGTAIPAGGTTISGSGGDLVLGADSGSGNVKTHAFTYTHDTAVTNVNGNDFADAFSIEATDTAAEMRTRSLLVLIVDDSPIAGFIDGNSAAASPQGTVDDGGRIGYLWWNDDTYEGGADDVPRQAYQAGVGGVRILSQPAEGTAYISDGTVPHPVSGFYANGAIIYDAPTDPTQAAPPAFEFTYELVDADGSVSNTNTIQVVVIAALNSTPNMLAAVPDSGDDQYTQLVVTWEYTDGSDWADIDRYNLRRSPTGAGDWVTVDANLPKQAADENGVESYTDTGLTPGEDYFYEVWAIDDDPYSAAQSLNQAQGTLPNYPTPAAPTGFTAAAQDFQSIQLDWTLPTPGTFDSVELEYQEDGAGGWTTIGGIAVDQVQYTHIGLKDSTQYNYRIRVRNRFGVPSAYATAFDTTGALVGPTFVSAVFDGIDKYTLTWNDANYETSYRLFRRINAGTQQELIPSPAADDTTYEDQPITQLGLEHEYELWSVRSGYATLTDTIADTPTAAKPATPPAPTVVVNSPTALDITWSDGAGPVTNVRLERSDDDPTPLTWTEVGTYAAGAGVAGITDSGLTPSTLYHYRVIAINQGTESDPSVHDSETTPSDLFKPVPTTPIPVITGNLKIGDTLTTTTGAWNANPAVSSYRYEWKADGTQVQNGASNQYTLLAGDAGKDITVEVWATNSQGESDTANISAAVTAEAAAVPSAGGAVTIAAPAGVLIGDTINLTAEGDPWDAGNPTDMGAKSYQWRSNTVDIAGETGTSYVIGAAEAGTTIDCVVTRTNSTGDGTATSNGIPVDAAADPTFDVPTLDSADLSPWEGNVISLNPITNLDYGNPDTGSLSYQWERDTTGVGNAYSDILGATNETYTVADIATEPEGTLIRCKVTATNDNAASLEQTTSNAATVVIIPVPYYSGGIGILQLDGDLLVGSRVECDEGTWSNNPSYEYRWDNVEDGPGISLNDIYTIQISDMGDNLNVTLTRVFNGVGDSPDAPVTSSNLQMAPAADPSGSPSIVERVPGDNSVNDFLDAVTGSWDFGNPPTQQGGFTYNWQYSSDDAVWNDYAPAQTGPSYQITQDDVDNLYYIRCQVTGTNTNSASATEDTNSIQVEELVTIPSNFVLGDWTATDAEHPTTPTINVSVDTLINGDGGSPVTRIDYRINGGPWTNSGETTIPSSFAIDSGLSFNVAVNIEIRAWNAVGPADDPGSDTKNRTPTQGVAGDVPDQFVVGDWDLTDAMAAAAALDVKINSLPADNGSPITDIEYWDEAIPGGDVKDLLDLWASGNDGWAVDFELDEMVVNMDGTILDPIAGGMVAVFGNTVNTWFQNQSGVLAERVANTQVLSKEWENGSLIGAHTGAAHQMQLVSGWNTTHTGENAGHAVATGELAPDGVETALRLTETATSTTQGAYKTISTGGSGSQGSYSCFFKLEPDATNEPLAFVALAMSDSSGANHAGAILDLATGQIVRTYGAGTGEALRARAVPFADGWVRVELHTKFNGNQTYRYATISGVDNPWAASANYGYFSYAGRNRSCLTQFNMISYDAAQPVPQVKGVFDVGEYGYQMALQTQSWYPIVSGFTLFIEADLRQSETVSSIRQPLLNDGVNNLIEDNLSDNTHILALPTTGNVGVLPALSPGQIHGLQKIAFSIDGGNIVTVANGVQIDSQLYQNDIFNSANPITLGRSTDNRYKSSVLKRVVLVPNNTSTADMIARTS